MPTNSLPTSASLSFKTSSFNNQSDFDAQLLHPKAGFPSNSYISSVHAFLFILSWHCPLITLVKKYLWKNHTSHWPPLFPFSSTQDP